MGRAGRIAAADVAAGDDLAVAGHGRPGASRRAFGEHHLVHRSVAAAVHRLAAADPVGGRFLGEPRDLRRGHAGALCDHVLGSAAAGPEAVSKSAVVLLSGGLDSMVCAGLAREAGFSVVALTVDYGQRHRIELDSARAIAVKLADRHILLPLDLRAFGG